MATKQAAIEAPTQAPSLQWSDLWRKPGWSGPTAYGVEIAEQDGKKYYRAWSAAGDFVPRRESAIFEAVDDADVTIPHQYQPMLPHARDTIIAKAAAVRAMMSPLQRSPRDMEALAIELHRQVQEAYQQYERDQEAKRKQAIDDEKCLLAARQVVRGLQLLLEHGTPTEQLLLKRFLPTK